ncbi:hypothetical protein DFP72DRAFT_369826 [Ephemerocybe angulata]|uniref:JmjC domain-containing protein n=1 Tax=Ephemerocybe angulata TaxID=980116 RepID=A0A8H6HWD8_9AGAR|nr:hypothetical protein DFP72DRAFT_369826 [Tulosesus angulatus]
MPLNRKDLGLIRNFPWTTSVIVDDEAGFREIAQRQDFNLMILSLFHWEDNYSKAPFPDLPGWTYSTIFAPIDQWPKDDDFYACLRTGKMFTLPKKITQTMAHTMTCLRLIDRTAYYGWKGDTRARRLARRLPETAWQARTNPISFNPKQWPLNDLLEHWRKARRLLSSVMNVDEDRVEYPENAEVPDGTKTRSDLALFCVMAERRKMGDAILVNFATAALHLNLLLQGEVFLSNTGYKKALFSKEFWKLSPVKEDGMGKILGPLNAAILIDPIYCLIAQNVAIQSPCLEEILTTGKALGTFRPPGLMDLNNNLLEVIWDLATGDLATSGLPERLLCILQDEPNTKAVADHRNFYSTSDGKPPSRLSEDSILLNKSYPYAVMDVEEGEVPPAKRGRDPEEGGGDSDDETKKKEKAQRKKEKAQRKKEQAQRKKEEAQRKKEEAQRKKEQEKDGASTDASDEDVDQRLQTPSRMSLSQLAVPVTPSKRRKRVYKTLEDKEKLFTLVQSKIISHSTNVRLAVPLSLADTVTARRATEAKLWTVKGKEVERILHFYLPDVQNLWDESYAAMTETFGEGKKPPVYSHDPSPDAIFCTRKYKDVMAMDTVERTGLVRASCLLVTHTEYKKDKLHFEDLLEEISPLDVLHSVQDQSGLYDVDNWGRQATFQQACDNEDLPFANQKPLNFLDLPDDMPRIVPFSADSVIWKRTSSDACVGEKTFPFGSFYWSLAASTGASHSYHTDSYGVSTYIKLKGGEKVVYIARQKNSSGELDHFDMETSADFNIWGRLPNSEVAGTLLQRGQAVVMRPGTLHAVFTTKSAVCYGGHFYSWPTMDLSLYSMVHSVILRSFIVNEDNPAPLQILVRYMMLLHRVYILGGDMDMVLPLLEQRADWECLGAFFCIITLLNVFDLDTYPCPDNHNKDRLLNDAKKRTSYAYARGLGTEILREMRSFSPPDAVQTSFREDVYVPMLAWTVLQFRLGFEAFHGPRKSRIRTVDHYWGEPAARTIFHQQLDLVLLNDMAVNTQYLKLETAHVAPTSLRTPDLNICEDGYDIAETETGRQRQDDLVYLGAGMNEEDMAYFMDIEE